MSIEWLKAPDALTGAFRALVFFAVAAASSPPAAMPFRDSEKFGVSAASTASGVACAWRSGRELEMNATR